MIDVTLRFHLGTKDTQKAAALVERVREAVEQAAADEGVKLVMDHRGRRVAVEVEG